MSEHVVCALSDLPPGAAKRVMIGKRAIAVFNVGGSFRLSRTVALMKAQASRADKWGVSLCPKHLANTGSSAKARWCAALGMAGNLICKRASLGAIRPG